MNAEISKILDNFPALEGRRPKARVRTRNVCNSRSALVCYKPENLKVLISSNCKLNLLW